MKGLNIIFIVFEHSRLESESEHKFIESAEEHAKYWSEETNWVSERHDKGQGKFNLIVYNIFF